MHLYYEILEWAVFVIQAVAAVILIWGVALAVKGFFGVLVSSLKKESARHRILPVKVELGRHILLGLEFLIAADIIETIVEPSVQDLLMLAGIVAIRTVISFFLNHEISETDEKIIEEDELKSGGRLKNGLNG